MNEKQVGDVELATITMRNENGYSESFDKMIVVVRKRTVDGVHLYDYDIRDVDAK